MSLAAVLLEVGARALLDPPRTHRGPAWFDPVLGFRGIPDHPTASRDEQGAFTSRLNEQGFRGRPLPDAPPEAGTLRVAFVGDSFLVAEALRDEQLMTARTEARLREIGVASEVYDLSAIDYGTAQELLLLRELRDPLRPQAVVLVVYPANDWINNEIRLAGTSRVSAGDAFRPYLPAVREDGEDAAPGEVRATHPFRAAARRISRVAAHVEVQGLARGWWSAFPQITPAGERLRQGLLPQPELEIFRVPRDGDAWDSAWTTSFSLLRAFRDECAAHGARLLVLVVPEVRQVVRTAKSIRLDVETRAAGIGPIDDLIDWSLPERRLADFFERERIEARLLLGPLRAAARAGERVYTRDEHLSPRGHELAAERVVEWLVAEAAESGGEQSFEGSPVDVLPPASQAPDVLDFTRSDHAAYLGDGFLEWQPASEAGGGWWIGPQALIALPLASRSLLLEGSLPADAAVPLVGRIAIVGGGEARFRIGRPGPFRLRVRVSPGPASESNGYAAVMLGPGVALARGGIPLGLLVTRIGFGSEPREPE